MLSTLPHLNADLLMPKQIGPYKIEGLLNKGGMSFLYLASCPEMSKPIAIKVPKSKKIYQRFLKEAEIIAMTNHPNVVQLYDQGEWEGGLYIAMELIRGVSLRQCKTLPQKRALQIIQQVAYALFHLHTHGVIHRDLKPENILISETNEVKVIDFGIAAREKEFSSEKRFMGTPVYMSPEQKEDPSLISFASDIYSLGIILYELISPMPKPLQKISSKALENDPKKRCEIADLIIDLSQYIQNCRFLS